MIIFWRAMETPRRHFLRKCGFATVGLLALRSHFLGYNFLDSADAAPYGYGPLLSDPKKILDLPKGFSYKVISRTAERMDDRLLVPGMHDDMAVFPGPHGKTIFIRNHDCPRKASDTAPMANAISFLRTWLTSSYTTPVVATPRFGRDHNSGL